MSRKRRALLYLALALPGFWALPAQAHVAASPGPEGSIGWQPDLWISTASLLTLGAYLFGLMRLWRSSAVGRGIGRAGAICFAGGVLVVMAALASPLDRLAGVLLSGHMVQHLLLIAVAPPLVVLGRAEIAFAWAMPRNTRRSLARNWFWRGLARMLGPLARPLPAALLHGAAIWIWHAPGLFQAALASPLLHDLEHATFFVTALAFWYATLFSARDPLAAIRAIIGLVITLIIGGLLGALLALTPEVLYPAYAGSSLPFGLTPLEDQQLAGLIMWVPASATYLGAALHLASRLLALSESRPESHRWRIGRGDGFPG